MGVVLETKAAECLGGWMEAETVEYNDRLKLISGRVPVIYWPLC